MDAIVLGGRRFRPVVAFTIEHRIWSESILARAGIIGAVMEPGEDADDFARRMWHHMRTGTELFNLLGMILIPEEMKDTDWTVTVANDTANFVRQLTEDEDYQTINDTALALLTGFFASGINSLEISRRLSPREVIPPRPSQIAESFHTGTGTRSSGKLRNTIIGRLLRSFGGLFVRR